MFAPVGDVSAFILHLSDFATLAALEGDVDRELRRRRPVNEVPRFEETVARVGVDGERLLAEGAAMSDGEVVRYALKEPGAPGDEQEP